MGQAGSAKPPFGGSSLIEVDRSKWLLKQARGTGTLRLLLSYLVGAGVVIVLTYLPSKFGDSARYSEFLPWLTCSLLVFVLGVQWTSEMRLNKRLDALVTLLTRKRLFDDEVTESQLVLGANASASRRPQA